MNVLVRIFEIQKLVTESLKDMSSDYLKKDKDAHGDEYKEFATVLDGVAVYTKQVQDELEKIIQVSDQMSLLQQALNKQRLMTAVLTKLANKLEIENNDSAPMLRELAAHSQEHADALGELLKAERELNEKLNSITVTSDE